jgi:guanyl-specific ribonuclease Sa
MQQKYSQFIIGFIVGAAALFLFNRQFNSQHTQHDLPQQPVVNNPVVTDDNSQKQNSDQQSSHNGIRQEGIPQKVYTVLQYVRANHQAMDGYEGGRVFTNRERIVPQSDNNGNPIDYQEWDVNPKIRGQNRGTERILTGSDGRAWYTHDHYQSFTEIK